MTVPAYELRATDEIVARFWPHVEKSDGCWTWKGRRNRTSYGILSDHHATRLAHRLSYAIAFGLVPEGMQVLHKCDNPSCVRPDHLFLGTPADNARDKCAKGRALRRVPVTHCVRGHELSGENLFFATQDNGQPSRRCRACNRMHALNYQREKRRRAAEKALCAPYAAEVGR